MAERLPELHLLVMDHLAETRGLKIDQKGYYLEILIYMHISPRRGYLLQPSGKIYSHDQLSGMTGVGSSDESSRLMQVLLDSGLICLTADGIQFSPRMVEKERLRLLGKQNGKLGGNPKLKGLTGGLTPSLIPPLKTGVNPSLEDENDLGNSGGREEGGVGGEEREALRLAVIDSFRLLPVSYEELDFLRDLVDTLWLKGAKPGDIVDRRNRYRKTWPTMACTPAALLRNWDHFAPPAANAPKKAEPEGLSADEAAWQALPPDAQKAWIRENITKPVRAMVGR